MMLAEAMVASPLRVVRVFPMPGDTGTNLHREAESICWDAVLVVRAFDGLDRSGILSVAEASEHQAESEASRWEANLADVKGIPFRAADRLNLFRTLLTGSALTPYPPSRGTPLESLIRSAVPLSTESNEMNLEHTTVAAQTASSG
jgi:hypothetical protein